MVARSGTGGILSGVGEDEIKRVLPGPQAVGQLPELEPVLAGPEIDRTTPRSRRHVAHVRDIGPSRGCPLVEVDGDGDHFDVARDIDVRRRDARDERVGLQVVGDPAPAGVRQGERHRVEPDHEHRDGPSARHTQAGDEPALDLAVQRGRDGRTIAVALVRQPSVQQRPEVVVQLCQEGGPHLPGPEIT